MNIDVLENADRERSNKSWRRLKQFFKAGPNAWRGASFSVIVWGYLLIFVAFIHAGEQWSIMDFTILSGLVIMLAITLVGRLLLLLARRVGKLPPHFHIALFTGGIFLVLLSWLLVEGVSIWILSGYMLVIFSLLGAGTSVWLTGSYRDLTMPQRVTWLVGSGLGLIGFLGTIVWMFFWSGPAYASPSYSMANMEYVSLADLEDPTQPGDFDILTLHYGSGTDKHRAEFGNDADLLTDSVDGTPFVGGWSGLSGWYRTRYWGFEDANFPLNGRVWYPAGAGPFPLVLIVHGAHNMADFSDGGYAYLGELLASRGYITVSVDQNFLNGGPPDIAGALQEENDARAWLLLEHLRIWHDWNSDPDHSFYQMVDTENIALIGQSRGGEAVAIAALFNSLATYPDNAQYTFDYGFNIVSVIAIAPTYGQYKPGYQDVVLQGTNYLAFQGSADADNETFFGQWQYDNVVVDGDDDVFKSAIYIHGANHGQFNTSWGASDPIGPQQFLLQRNLIMPAADQEQITKSLVSAFLEFTLKGQDEYRMLFIEPLNGTAFLPERLLLSHFMDSNIQLLADFEEDFDPSTARYTGAYWQSENLTMWKEQVIPNKFQDDRYGSNAAFVGWDTSVNPGETPRFTLMLADNNITESAALHVGLAASERHSDCFIESDATLDFHIELVDDEGNIASLPLSMFGNLFPESRFAYAPWKAPLSNENTSEIVLDTFVLPLYAFADANKRLDLGELRSINFVFTETDCGVVIIDDLGFKP